MFKTRKKKNLQEKSKGLSGRRVPELEQNSPESIPGLTLLPARGEQTLEWGQGTKSQLIGDVFIKND